MPDSSTIDTPDLVASTGLNDASSPWNSLLASALQTGVNIGNSELQSALGLQTPVNRTTGGNGAPVVVTPPAPVVAAAAVTPHSSGLGGLSTGAIIAAVVALLAVVFLMRK